MVIYEVTEDIMEEVYQKVMKDEMSEKEAYYRNVVVPIVKNTNSYLYVLEENDTYIGTGGLILTKKNNIDKYIYGNAEYETSKLFTDTDLIGVFCCGYIIPEKRRKGYGRKLYDKRKEKALQQNVDYGFAEVWVYNKKQDSRKPLHSYGWKMIYERKQNYWKSNIDETLYCPVCGFDCNCYGQLWMKEF